ncbi:lipase member H [Melanotaenia boesemani]|uniref:lipase member H n=1 Tax=Melanotaenia boesemani TaxID=1250792 RepID=UPI001C048C31|nr:lipase member H [Melanotaenia boesemani]XP_041823404.1 lipase member H [Melanotaenia boesemani]
MLPHRLLGLLGLLVLCKGQAENKTEKSCDDFTDLNLSHCFLGTRLYVRLLLYTRSNLDCGLEINHHHLSSQPLLNLQRPTTFVIHGYRPTGAPPIWINHIIHLLAEQEDMNIIVVDWNRGAANLNYFTTVAYTREAAQNLTGFIMEMEEEGAALSSVHLIGVSLGAHLAGYVGANLKGKIGRITGLDPAGPLFASATPEERLDPSDAMFVDVLHTDMDSFGLRGAHGHIDFYANGGVDQPGCPKTIFSGKSYFVCDHQRSVFLFLCSLNRTCHLTGYPCASYTHFLDARCLQCEAFKPASCPVLGYDVSQWRDTLLRLGQTKVFFSTTGTLPYKKLSYRVDMVTWNQYLRWGVVYIRLHSGRNFTETRIDHKLLRFEQYTSTRLLAQFDEDLQHIQKISMRINTGNIIGPRYKIRLLRIRFTPLEHPDRPLMCRFDIIVEENMEVTFRPLPCTSQL